MTQARESKKPNADNPLPRWQLGDLYPAPDGAELEGDLKAADGEAKRFSKKYQGKLTALNGARLAGAIADYERQQERLARIMSYAQLRHAGDMSDPEIGRFAQGMREQVTAIDSNLLFFTLEINRLEEKNLRAKLKDPALAHYRPWLRDLRATRPHQLSDELERLLHDKEVAGQTAWIRLFDETIAALRFPLGEEALTSAEVLDRLSDADGAVRRQAAKAIGEVFGDNLRLFAHITNTLASEKSIEDRWRGFARPVSARNLANRVEDEVVDALVSAVEASYPKLSHRYYALKAGWMGVGHLDYWDRNAPLPETSERRFGWNDARGAVLDAYAGFAPELAEIGQRFFDNDWIDAEVRPGKAPGAFSASTVPSVHPYILMNYQGKSRDVMTLAHELGHGVHQVLAAERGLLMASTPLTLAETASVFGEMLTFRALLGAESDGRRRKALLAGKVEDMLNTVIRQISFYEFERRIHDERANGELLPEKIGDIWMETQRQSLGPVFRFDEEYRHFWAYIPHFIHAPFYVYAYAFGDCLVNSLYAVYQHSEAGFAEKYLDMLRAGGTKRHKELLAPFGLDASDPEFWGKGLSMIAGFIDELEAMD
ncbi:MAG: M3 family oligoendopeptidase [Alphaproteobacteria bacterium]